MQFRSIISLFIVVCLIVVAFLGNVAESGKLLDKHYKNSINLNKRNLFAQRLRRAASSTHRRRKRDDFASNDSTGGTDNGPLSSNDGSDPSMNGAGLDPSYPGTGSVNSVSFSRESYTQTDVGGSNLQSLAGGNDVGGSNLQPLAGGNDGGDSNPQFPGAGNDVGGSNLQSLGAGTDVLGSNSPFAATGSDGTDPSAQDITPGNK